MRPFGSGKSFETRVLEMENISIDAVISAAIMQQKYQALVKKGKLSKKAICDLCVPFKEKYGLQDSQVLRIARQEISLMDLLLLLKTEKPAPDPNLAEYEALAKRDEYLARRWLNGEQLIFNGELRPYEILRENAAAIMKLISLFKATNAQEK